MTKILFNRFTFVLALLVAAISTVMPKTPPPTIHLPAPSAALPPLNYPMPEEEMLALGYQVDVFVTSNHMTKHDTSNAAMRCLTNNGNVAAFSEFNTWTLHLLCWDGKTLFDIIMTRLNKHVQSWENPYSYLKTAYAPEGVQGANMLEKVELYLAHLKSSVGGKVVNLTFRAGEIMFLPK